MGYKAEHPKSKWGFIRAFQSSRQKSCEKILFFTVQKPNSTVSFANTFQRYGFSRKIFM